MASIDARSLAELPALGADLTRFVPEIARLHKQAIA